MRIRGIMTVGFVGIMLTVGDLIQRSVIPVAVWLLPSRRHRILSAWIRAWARTILRTVEIVGGAHIDSLPRVPDRPGVLVLMNHQSLLDIPLVVRAFDAGYPRIVTRARYARGKPLISSMVRFYQYPTVDPGATVRGQMERLRETARSGTTPMVIFPEGTRSRTGRIGRFKTAGLKALLEARRWEVWLLVADGYWHCGRLDDFMRNVSGMRGRMTRLGPFASPGPEDDMDAFIADMRRRMTGALDALRAGGAPP